MIVNLTQDGWEIIYHRAHALLAAKIAGQWPSKKSPRLYETIAAISHHDDLEQEWKGYHLTKAGAPQDFQLDPNVSVEQLTQLIEGARYRSRWVALLTSMHVCFLHQNQADQSEALKDFIEQQQHLQRHWRKTMDIPKEEASQAYEFMRWCDRLSLILVQRHIPANGRSLEITDGLDNQSFSVRQTDDMQITVEPWPFSASKFNVSAEAQYLTTLKYDTEAAFEKALREEARTQDIDWTLAKTTWLSDLCLYMTYVCTSGK